MVHYSILVFKRFSEGGLHGSDAGKVLRSASQARFLTASLGEVFDVLAFVVEEADTPWSMELMGTEGSAVDIPGFEVNWEFAQLLGCIGMKVNWSINRFFVVSDDLREGG